jgi:hypothetical protein
MWPPLRSAGKDIGRAKCPRLTAGKRKNFALQKKKLVYQKKYLFKERRDRITI